MTLDDAVQKYGEITDGRWKNERDWMITYAVPKAVAVGWINTYTGTPTIHVYCNMDIQGALDRAFKNVLQRNLENQLKTFDGCYCIRSVRGEDKLSAHAYGLALDLNAATNQLGGLGDISEELVNCFKDAGWRWGGDFARKDPMHFQYQVDW